MFGHVFDAVGGVRRAGHEHQDCAVGEFPGTHSGLDARHSGIPSRRSHARTCVSMDMINTPITACVMTHNDEISIRACLESLAWCDELVVVDAQSSDRTRDIAAQCGARVLESGGAWRARPPFAVRAAKHEWILLLRTDE